MLWDIAFPVETLDEGSTLGDIFEVALRTAGNRTRELLNGTLRVDTNALPEEYAVWFSMPWARIYTLNIDDLDEAVARTFDLPRDVDVVSAVAQEPLGSRDRLQSVHLNGTLSDFPDVTFSARQYGVRLSQPDLWYDALKRDLRASPVVFVGTSLDEPPLWQHVELRGRRGSGRELRPGSYLVTPSLPVARRAILADHFNVDWIPMSQEEFAGAVLRQLSDAQREGIRHFAAQGAIGREAAALQRVADLRSQPAQDLREYLWGREPVWADLGADGFAVHREFESEISDVIAESDARALVLTGTGGSGKSTTLMRFGLERQAQGQDVRWLNLESEVSIPRLRAAVRESETDVLLIDDLDSFGTQAGPFLSELLTDNPNLFVAATIRASRYEPLEIERHLAELVFAQMTVPQLQDRDIELLLDALTRAQRLGQLRGKTPAEQVKAFQREAGRQLLVAMIQATSGERFDEKVNRECQDLGPETGHIYAVVALATVERQYLTKHEIALASGEPSNEALNRLQGLLNQHLLAERAPNQIRLRHRVIAEKAVEFFHGQRQLTEPIRGLMFALATGIDRARYPRGREGRLLTRLMNHSWLMRHLTADREAVRTAYDAIEDLVSWDHHYWLQRGSYEVEVGDLQLAQNLLEQARSLAPEDYKVQTEWAYLVIKRAAQNPDAPDSRERVEEAFIELEDAVTRRGHQDSYAAHVMGSQGLSWARQAPLSREEKLGLLARLRGVVDDALEHHASAGDLRQLSRDLEQEYLIVGAVRQPDTIS
jgi:tetratricopeptide (TPR) repeat protein